MKTIDGLSGNHGTVAVFPQPLLELLQSPESINDRISRHQEAKRQHDEALSALNLGNDIKAAHEEAQQKLAAAEQLRMAAQGRADSAAEALDAARKQADALIAAAERKVEEARALIAKERAEHDAYVRGTQEEIAVKWQELARLGEVNRRSAASADAVMARAIKAQADADKAMADAKAKVERHKAKLAKAKAELDD